MSRTVKEIQTSINSFHEPMMGLATNPELSALLNEYDATGGVLDYLFFVETFTGPPANQHRAAALTGMELLARRQEAANRHLSDTYPNLKLHHLTWDEAKLTGEPITFARFWGNENAGPEQISQNAWAIPEVNGYKTAFFNPPYGLQGTAEKQLNLFAGINNYLLGDGTEQVEIYSWSTNGCTNARPADPTLIKRCLRSPLIVSKLAGGKGFPVVSVASARSLIDASRSTFPCWSRSRRYVPKAMPRVVACGGPSRREPPTASSSAYRDTGPLPGVVAALAGIPAAIGQQAACKRKSWRNASALSQ